MRPILFSAAGFEFHTAPIFAGLSSLAAFLYFRSLRPYTKLSLEDFWGLMLLMAASVIGGAAAFYVFIYHGGLEHNLRYLIANKRIPGGSFWGSFWITTAFVYSYCRFKKIEFRPVADAVALSAMLAIVIMRMGCFLNGCCHGLPTALPWGIAFGDPQCAVRKALLGQPLHPSQLYEAAGSGIIFFAAHFAFLKRLRPPAGGVFAFTVFAYSVMRFFIDFTRGGDPGIFAACGLSTSQFISILSASAGSILWHRMKTR